jgi:hypothetical protein
MVTSLPLGICSPDTGEVIFIILALKRGLFVGPALIMEIGASVFEEKLDINWEDWGEGEWEGDGDGRERFTLSRVDDIPVTLTLYHLVRFGGHSSLAVILLSDPSLIEV